MIIPFIAVKKLAEGFNSYPFPFGQPMDFHWGKVRADPADGVWMSAVLCFVLFLLLHGG